MTAGPRLRGVVCDLAGGRVRHRWAEGKRWGEPERRLVGGRHPERDPSGPWRVGWVPAWGRLPPTWAPAPERQLRGHKAVTAASDLRWGVAWLCLCRPSGEMGVVCWGR